MNIFRKVPELQNVQIINFCKFLTLFICFIANVSTACLHLVFIKKIPDVMTKTQQTSIFREKSTFLFMDKDGHGTDSKLDRTANACLLSALICTSEMC